jgi:hypothetical protein
MALERDQFLPPALLGLPVNMLPEFAEVLEGADEREEDDAVHPQHGKAIPFLVPDGDEHQRDRDDLRGHLGLAEVGGLDGVAFGRGDGP